MIPSFVLQLFDVHENGSGAAILLALPEIAWDLSLGIYAAWKGFRTSSPLDRVGAFPDTDLALCSPMSTVR